MSTLRRSLAHRQARSGVWARLSGLTVLLVTLSSCDQITEKYTAGTLAVEIQDTESSKPIVGVKIHIIDNPDIRPKAEMEFRIPQTHRDASSISGAGWVVAAPTRSGSCSRIPPTSPWIPRRSFRSEERKRTTT